VNQNFEVYHLQKEYFIAYELADLFFLNTVIVHFEFHDRCRTVNQYRCLEIIIIRLRDAVSSNVALFLKE
jgi:hypothetical protein